MANLVAKVDCATRNIVNYALRSGGVIFGPFISVIADIVVTIDEIATVHLYERQGSLAEFDP